MQLFGLFSVPGAEHLHTGKQHSASEEKAVPRIEEPSVQGCREDREGHALRVML